jgi:hypothetical protein
MWVGSATFVKTRKMINHNKVKATPRVVGNKISKRKRKRIKQYMVDVLL